MKPPSNVFIYLDNYLLVCTFIALTMCHMKLISTYKYKLMTNLDRSWNMGFVGIDSCFSPLLSSLCEYLVVGGFRIGLISLPLALPAVFCFRVSKHAILSDWSTFHSFPSGYLALIIHPSDSGSLIASSEQPSLVPLYLCYAPLFSFKVP